MCQAKSEGGRRCNRHLTLAITHAVTHYASAVSGLSSEETSAAFERLRREGAHRPDPTRGETDALLLDTAAQVHRDPDLPEHQRNRILAALRAGVGRLRLDGGRFHALRHLVAEAWVRGRKRVAAVAVAAPLVLGLGACGTSTHQDAHSAQQGTVATAPASPSQQDTEAPAPQIDDEARTIFGQQQIEQGYQEAVTVAEKYDLQPRLLANTQPTPADLDGITSEMTPVGATSYRQQVQNALNGDATASGDVRTATLYGAVGEGFTPNSSGTIVTAQKITSPQISVDHTTGTPRMAVTFDHQATIHGTQNGKPATAQASQPVTYWLVPDKAHPSGWLVDGWTGSYRVTDPVAAR